MKNMVFQFDISGLEFAFLILNYLVLAGYFLYRYLKPIKWFVKSTVSFFLVYAITLLMLVIPFLFEQISEPDICLMLMFVISFFSIVYVIRGELKEHGTVWIPPFALYLFSVGQELFRAINTPGNEAVGRLLGWYLLSPLFIMIMAPAAIFVISRILPGALKRQEKISLKEMPASPSGFAIMGLAYVVWMLIRLTLEYMNFI